MPVLLTRTGSLSAIAVFEFATRTSRDAFLYERSRPVSIPVCTPL
ncbi:hypothetical protein [Oxynema sp. CENA135]|nr:hypothetical protein [Oxynema sp. CENA135]